MKLLNKIAGKITEKILEGQRRFFVRGLCRAMLVAFHAARLKYPSKTFYGDYAKLALTTRPNWTQVDDETFRYKNGWDIKIERDDSLYTVIEKIVWQELWYLTKSWPLADRESFIDEGLKEAEEFFKQAKDGKSAGR